MASDAVQRFRARAAAIGVEVEVVEFPAGTRTAADAAAAIGCEVAQIVKSLVFMADEAPVLALTSGANRVDETKLAKALGVEQVTKADARQVRSATGYAIGGTPPFAHDTEVTIVCDQDLLAHEVLWAAAGTPTTVFALSPGVLVETTSATVTDLAG